MSSPRRLDRIEPDRIEEPLLERVLEKLGLTDKPSPDLSGLGSVYSAWCRGVPFDNVRKLIWLREEIPGPLPGDDAADFFAAWLDHGTGGTCWAGNGALQALVSSLGFEARRGYGTMLVSADIPPNHGTVVVRVEGEDHLVDASILFDEAMPAREGASVDHPAWGVTLKAQDDEGGRLRIQWRPFHMDLDCRLESLDATREEFRDYHEKTRDWSPFNYALSARHNDGESVVGVSFGQLAAIDAEGKLTLTESPSEDQRRSFLIDRLGISEEMADRLPADQPMPPPPAS
jgi:N-hydroxyarylamine O-acetyltransferase